MSQSRLNFISCGLLTSYSHRGFSPVIEKVNLS